MLNTELLLTAHRKVGTLRIEGASDEGFARVYFKDGTRKDCYGFDIWEFPNDQIMFVTARIATITRNMIQDSKTGDWIVVDIYKDAYLEFDTPY